MGLACTVTSHIRVSLSGLYFSFTGWASRLSRTSQPSITLSITQRPCQICSIQSFAANNSGVKLKVNRFNSSWQVISEPWGVTCHMGSHSVTFHPTQVTNTSHLNPSQIGRYSIYLPWRDGRLSWPRWLVTYRDGLSAHRRSPIQVLTWPGVD